MQENIAKDKILRLLCFPAIIDNKTIIDNNYIIINNVVRLAKMAVS